MRKAQNNVVRQTQMTRQAGYHANRMTDKAKYFTSDRYEVLENGERPNGKPLKGYGLELETESNLPNVDTHTTLFKEYCCKDLPDGLFARHEHDGTLTGLNLDAEKAYKELLRHTSHTDARNNICEIWNAVPQTGVEHITQILTKECVRNQYPNFRAMFERMEHCTISTTATGHCGMHINISYGCFGGTPKTQWANCMKLMYFVNHNYALMCSLVRRPDHLTRWCGYMGEFDNIARCKEYAEHRNYSFMNGAHTNCMNYSHNGRIELRLVGGQKNFPTFRNTMETVFHLVDAVKNTPWEKLDDLVGIFSGCNAHVFDRLTLALNENKISAGVVELIRPTVTESIYNAR